MAKCKGCGAEIIWTPTRGGKMMHIDAKTIRAYRKTFTAPHDSGLSDEYQPIDVHQVHWATCPNAKDFKKPKVRKFMKSVHGIEEITK